MTITLIGLLQQCQGINSNQFSNFLQSSLNQIVKLILNFLRNRFKVISSCISFDDFISRNERKVNYEKFHKMRVIYDMFRTNIRKAFNPGKHLTIDETLYSYRGHCSHRQYIKSKPAKYGLKYNNIVDTQTAYLLDTNPYLGKSNQSDKNANNLGQKIVESLAENFYGTKRFLFIKIYCSFKRPILRYYYN